MYWRLISLEEIIQIWIVSSKDINLQYLCKTYCRELEQYWCCSMHLKKSVMRPQITVFKNCNKWTPVYKGHWRWKLIFWINAHSPVEKQSNQDPSNNTLIHLKNNGSHIKVPLIFRFLIMSFYLCFITYCGLNGYVYILERVLDILNKLIDDSQNICGYLTLNEIHTKLTSLMIFSNNRNLINTSWTPTPPEGKKQYCI